MTEPDFHLTPRPIAELMVGAVGRDDVASVADFAVGNGDLLLAAMKKWQNALCVGTDIAADRLRRLRSTQREWRIGRCDFMSQVSRKRCLALKSVKSGFDVVLLNPPFTCRGGRRVECIVDETPVVASVALGFMIAALPYVSQFGEVVSILPESSLTCAKDANAWDEIRRKWNVSTVVRCAAKTFRSCFAKTVVVKLRRDNVLRAQSTPPVSCNVSPLSDTVIRIVRGLVPMHERRLNESETLPLIHSSNLINGRVLRTESRSGDLRRVVWGPAVLIPRVGLPDVRKVALLTGRQKVVLSDCVICLCCRARTDAIQLQAILRSKWERLRDKYAGTCAPYIQVEAIRQYLSELGYAAVIDASTRNSKTLK